MNKLLISNEDLLLQYLKESIMLESPLAALGYEKKSPVAANLQLIKKIKKIYYNPAELTDNQKRLLNLISTLMQLLDPTGLSSIPDVTHAFKEYKKKKTYMNLLNLVWSASSLIPVLGKVNKLGNTMQKSIKALGALHDVETICNGLIIDRKLQNHIEGIKKSKSNDKIKKDFENLAQKIEKHKKYVKVLKSNPVFTQEKIKTYTEKVKSNQNKSKTLEKSKLTSKETNSIKSYLKNKITDDLIKNHIKSIDLYRTKKKKTPYIKSANNMKKIISKYVKNKNAVNKIVHQNNWKRSNEKIINRIIKRTEYFAAKYA